LLRRDDYRFTTALIIPQKAVLWIRIRSDPELFAGSGVGSGINHFGSGSGQSGSGMNLIPNFSVKKEHFLNKMHKNYCFNEENFSILKSKITFKKTLYFIVNLLC
jgi:hypothetical protein